jgi:hypothetical protein
LNNIATFLTWYAATSIVDDMKLISLQGHIRYLISVGCPPSPRYFALITDPSLQYGKTQFQTMKGTLINSGVLTE